MLPSALHQEEFSRLVAKNAFFPQNSAPMNFCPQHFRRQQLAEYYGLPQNQNQELIERVPRSRLSSGFGSFQMDSEFASNLERLLRQSDQRFLDVLTPPATNSSSRSTLFSCNSVPSFNARCSSPVLSEDFSRSHTSLSNYDQSVYSMGEEDYLLKGCYTKEGGGVIYGRENIYTAETVHGLVKSRRDPHKARYVSNKVFVGGISHATHRESINTFFAQFGPVFIDWPVKGPRTNGKGKSFPTTSYSYLFLVYVDEQSVIKLMQKCHNTVDNEFFVKVPGCLESIQIRPWFIKNGFYISKKAHDEPLIDIHRTVFVGGLPRIVTAKEIAHMFSEFGKVLLVTIDIDQDYGYPKGAARVVFERDSSFNEALEKKYLRFDNIDSSKTTIEIKPYVMEDVGCDQCGGLWFNPFLEVFDQLKNALKFNEKRKTADSSPTLGTDSWPEMRSFDMWSCNHPFSVNSTNGSPPDFIAKKDKKPEPDIGGFSESENDEIVNGARKLLKMTKAFDLTKPKTVNIQGSEVPIGPDLWNRFIPPPSYEVMTEPLQMRMEQQIDSYLRLKRGNVYSNKSSYCKEKPCRQYYCPSCSNKLHQSGPNQHVLLPAGKPERRPRKDKNMYLVTQQ